jgi:hypothetical protein
MALNHGKPSHIPRGELFFSRKFLDVFFPRSQGDYAGQVASAASLLGLSVVGVDLNEECSRSLMKDGAFGRLKNLFTVGNINGPVLHAISKLGFRKAMVFIRKDPRVLTEISLDLLQDIRSVCKLARQNGLSAILLADDIAGNRGLLFSYDDFTKTILPMYKQVADTIKKQKLCAFFHSDGDTRAVIGSIAEAGYDCIHPVDSQAGLNLYDVTGSIERKVTFMGHIDIITWDYTRIVQEIRNAETEFSSGGLILGSTSGLSMKTVSKKLSALYPQWQSGEEKA